MYHFIGIKGSGMSSLAIIMKKMGYDVEGSDYAFHYFTEKNLLENGIKIKVFNKNNITNNMIIVKGNTFNEENEELKEAINKKLLIYTYQEMVKKITEKYNLIAVSGCHGKTTTSKMLATVMNASYLIGDGSGDIKDTKNFVLEACEYKKHFLNYTPQTVIITNIDLDHVDYYNNVEEVIEAFNEFIQNASTVIIYGEDKYINKIKAKQIYTYGLDDKDYFQARNCEYKEDGIKFDLYINKKYTYTFNLPFFGKHMLLNTLAVISASYLEKIDIENINQELKNFKGAKRRFNEYKVNDNIIIDDYAHHPNEIKATILAARQKYLKKTIIGVFEPHTYSRVKKFYKEMAESLNNCDYVYIMDIYKSRENQKDYPNITSNLVLNELKNGEKITKNEVEKLTKHKNAVIIFMSPNDLRNMENEYSHLYKNIDKQ